MRGTLALSILAWLDSIIISKSIDKPEVSQEANQGNRNLNLCLMKLLKKRHVFRYPKESYVADIKLSICDFREQNQDWYIETTCRQSLAQDKNFLAIRVVGYFGGVVVIQMMSIS